jgi:hypothetical protein
LATARRTRASRSSSLSVGNNAERFRYRGAEHNLSHPDFSLSTCGPVCPRGGPE